MPKNWSLNFKQLPTSGIVPGTPCSEFRYSYTFLIPMFFDTGFGVGVETFKPKWTFEIRTGDGTMLWKQAVALTGVAITGFGGLVGYYFLVNSATVTTTYADGTVVTTTGTESTAGGYVPLEESPTWGLGLEVGMWGEWDSSDYLTRPQPLPAGAVVHIDFHTAGLAGLTSKYAPFQFATNPQGAAAALRSPEHGMIFLARPAPGGGIDVVADVDLAQLDPAMAATTAQPWRTTPVTLARAPMLSSHLSVGAVSRLWLLRGRTRTCLTLFWNTGSATWYSQTATNAAADADWSDPIMVLSTPSLAVAQSPDGGIYYHICNPAGGAQVIPVVACYEVNKPALQALDGWDFVLDDGTFPTLPNVQGTLTINRGVANLIFTQGASTDIYVSRDGLRTWSH